MTNDKGTPKTLDEAIVNAFCVGPLSEIRQRARHVLKDYLSQKFGVAVLSHPEIESILLDLFKEITKE